ncbi:MAG: polysaccharide deacetylase family protein [Alphaproteobacteria bacterium]|nr:polysaccharide deacetylase family protein [Alphaproteobacteria bacterium]
MASWPDLEQELGRWAGLGRTASLWWRDDDAVRPGPKLRRLIDLSKSSRIALALAVIPGQAEDALGKVLAELPEARMLVHGLHHENHAPDSEKKAEFGAHRPVHEMLGDTAIAWENLTARFPDQAMPVFVPPWNRIADDLVARLPLARLRGLSRFGPRAAAQPAAGLLECNCHLDLIDWRGGRGFIGENQALDILIAHLQGRRMGSVDGAESSGVLSHHDVMDRNSWDFLAELLARTQECDGAHWLTMNEVFRLP